MEVTIYIYIYLCYNVRDKYELLIIDSFIFVVPLCLFCEGIVAFNFAYVPSLTNIAEVQVNDVIYIVVTFIFKKKKTNSHDCNVPMSTISSTVVAITQIFLT